MGLRTSWSKTKLQNIASGSVPTAAFIDGQCVEVVDSFLLGSEITSSGYSSCDIIHCIGLASWTVSGVIANSACPLTCAFTTAVFWHCCCTVWTILKANRQKLQSFHLRCQWRILGIRWFYFVTNADVSARTGLTDVHSIISQRRYALFGGFLPTLQLTRSSTWQSKCSIEVFGMTSPGDVLRADHIRRGYINSQMTSASPQASYGTRQLIGRSGQLYDP